ncbi:hypothetical protein ACIPK7_06360 [Pseudomonas sp. NPDC086581]|uniref:hypothetical protein n=1 Tax=Pseudomonas sp. NPDC086581 TaxID=3364432 RepID=UPI00380206E1
MAVYEVKQAELVRVAEQIDEVFHADWDKCGSVENALLKAGFIPHDEVSSAYIVFRRLGPGLRERKDLPGTAYVWVLDELCSMDIVLAGDSLPDYLMMMRLLEPVVRRAKALEKELEAVRRNREYA